MISNPGPSGTVRCTAYHSTTQTLTTATWTALAFDSEDEDTHGMHSTSANTSRFTIPTGQAGRYRFTLHLTYASHAAGDRIVVIVKNGGTFPTGWYSKHSWPASATQDVNSHVAVMELTAADGDYFEFLAYQSSGGNLDVGNATSRFVQTQVDAIRIG